MKFRPQRTVINGQEYQYVEDLPGVEGGTWFVICADSRGNRYVCTAEVWIRSPEAASAGGNPGAAQGMVPAAAEVSVPRPAPAAVAPASGWTGQSRSLREEKLERQISLFLSLFRGREDVYALRFENRRTDKRGYSFVCANKWDRNLCDIKKDGKKGKCSGKCPGRSYCPMTREAVRSHLMGEDPNCEDVLGAYPLEPDDTTTFLALDLDEASWKEDVTALRETCKITGVTPAVERSRSGNGAHIWFFFSEKVKAATARRFGCSLVTCTMARCGRMSFQSYDRMFPNQDYLPKGGLGNLIALPLQGKARKQGNSVFIDEKFEPYHDQWKFLGDLPRIRPDELEAFLYRMGESNLGDTTPMVEPDEKKPLPRQRAGRKLQRKDFPDQVTVGLRSMVFVKKKGLSPQAMDAIRRLAVVPNPEFYEKQRNRIPMNLYGKTYTPRVIDCGYEDEVYLGIPRGGRQALMDLLEANGVPVQVRDERENGRPIDVSFLGKLRPEQEAAANALLEGEIGILQAATAFGKTVVGAYLIAARKVNTLILVNSNALQEQWKKALEQFLEIREVVPEALRGRRKDLSPIGQLGGGRKDRYGFVDIANVQSMFSKKDTEAERIVKPLIRDYGMIIVDECHHGAARTHERVLGAAPARYVYGLTATPKRKDGLESIFFLHCGPIVYRHTGRETGEGQEFLRYMIPCFTKMHLSEPVTYLEACNAMVDHRVRNTQILSDAVDAVARGRTPILLTGRTEHARNLAKALEGKADHVFLLIGSEKLKIKREKLAALRHVSDQESLILVATYSYVGEGFDFPRLDTLLLTMPISFEGRVEQYTGRIHRTCKGKAEVIVYDYVDVHVPVLERMYHKRLKAYGCIGYKVWSGRPEEITSRIFNGSKWQEPFQEDLEMARSSIRIVSPRLQSQRIGAVLPVLKAAVARGVSVTVYTRYPEEAGQAWDSANGCIRTLREAEVAVEIHGSYQQCCAVVDGRITWHGSICFLGPSTDEDSALRYVNADLAGELMEAVEDCRNGVCGEQMMMDL